MSFMRKNRAANGVAQPEAVAANSAAMQRKSRKLTPNYPIDNSAEDWRFAPSMSTCEAINDAHYHAGVKDEPFNADYDSKIPFVGFPDTLKKLQFKEQ